MSHEYDVGYKKPPSHSRFQKGRSGNPNGRGKSKPKSVLSALDAELKEKITITENGEKKKISKEEAIAKRIILGVLNGDRASMVAFVKHLPLLQELRVQSSPSESTPALGPIVMNRIAIGPPHIRGAIFTDADGNVHPAVDDARPDEHYLVWDENMLCQSKVSAQTITEYQKWKAQYDQEQGWAGTQSLATEPFDPNKDYIALALEKRKRAIQKMIQIEIEANPRHRAFSQKKDLQKEADAPAKAVSPEERERILAEYRRREEVRKAAEAAAAKK